MNIFLTSGRQEVQEDSFSVSRGDIESKLWQLAGKRDFSILLEIDGFLYIFDRLPKRMKLVVDYKIQGMENREISRLLKIKEKSVYQQLSRALRLFLHHLA